MMSLSSSILVSTCALANSRLSEPTVCKEPFYEGILPLRTFGRLQLLTPPMVRPSCLFRAVLWHLLTSRDKPCFDRTETRGLHASTRSHRVLTHSFTLIPSPLLAASHMPANGRQSTQIPSRFRTAIGLWFVAQPSPSLRPRV